MPSKDDPAELIKEAQEIIDLQNELENQVLSNPEFKRLIDYQKELNDKIAAGWKIIEGRMILANVKSVKGDFGSITIAERTTYKADDVGEVPRKYLKFALDTKKIDAAAKLEGKLPKGVTSSVTQYLTKRLK